MSLPLAQERGRLPTPCPALTCCACFDLLRCAVLCSAALQYRVALPILEGLLLRLKQNEGLQGRITAEWLDQADCVGERFTPAY